MPDLIDPRDLPALRALVGRRLGPKGAVHLPVRGWVSGEEAERLCAGLEPLDAPGVTPGPACVGEAADARHR